MVTGLGLAVCHGIVKEHDGFIEISDNPGGGTVFNAGVGMTMLPRIGQAEEGLRTIDMAWSFADANREGFWKAELQRLKGELLLQAWAGGAASWAR